MGGGGGGWGDKTLRGTLRVPLKGTFERRGRAQPRCYSHLGDQECLSSRKHSEVVRKTGPCS